MKKNNILIVEDDKDLRETWKMFFNRFEIDIHTASNGIDAQEIINQYPLEIVVTDLQIPVKDGYFVLEYAKSKNIDTKVWVCSGHLLSDKDLANQYNIDKILIKPFNMLSIVEELISITSEKNANPTCI